MNGKDFTIGVLSVTATVLLAAFIIVQTLAPQPALASGQGGTIGEYVVSTAFVDDQCEVLSIINTTAQRMNVYQLDQTTSQLIPIAQYDLRVLQQQQGPGRTQRRR